MSHVLYLCPDPDCGNAVTSAQVDYVNVPALNVAIAAGDVLCAAPKHAMDNPAMRRVEVDA